PAGRHAEPRAARGRQGLLGPRVRPARRRRGLSPARRDPVSAVGARAVRLPPEHARAGRSARALCPAGRPPPVAVPFGLQIIQVPSIKRIFILSGGSTRPWREIYMDGRPHPPPELLNPSYFGHSIGHWEGDTLVIDTIGFNERFWIHREGYPHTEALHLVERISRPDVDTLRYEITIDDPRTYTRPWTAAWTKQWTPDEDIIEYFCHDNNRDQYHMVGAQ